MSLSKLCVLLHASSLRSIPIVNFDVPYLLSCGLSVGSYKGSVFKEDFVVPKLFRSPIIVDDYPEIVRSA